MGPTQSTVLSASLAARLAAESARRGVPESTIVGEAVEAYLDEEPTDESVLFIGGHLAPEEPLTTGTSSAL